jgi:hypothetical protein
METSLANALDISPLGVRRSTIGLSASRCLSDFEICKTGRFAHHYCFVWDSEESIAAAALSLVLILDSLPKDYPKFEEPLLRSMR